MNLTGLGGLLSMMYTDKVDIYRTVKIDNEDGTTDVSYPSRPTYAGVPCRLSFRSDDTGADSQVDRNPIAYNPKLFCKSGVDLQAGDRVVVYRLKDDRTTARVYEGVVADPTWYTTHQEAFMRIDRGA